MSDFPREVEDLGNLDGERPHIAQVKITSAGIVDRAMLRGERVALMVIGEVTGIGFKTVAGALVRTHTVKAETIAEATGQLGEDVTTFLRLVEDAREGRTQLPLDQDDVSDEEESE